MRDVLAGPADDWTGNENLATWPCGSETTGPGREFMHCRPYWQFRNTRCALPASWGAVLARVAGAVEEDPGAVAAGLRHHRLHRCPPIRGVCLVPTSAECLAMGGGASHVRVSLMRGAPRKGHGCRAAVCGQCEREASAHSAPHTRPGMRMPVRTRRTSSSKSKVTVPARHSSAMRSAGSSWWCSRAPPIASASGCPYATTLQTSG